VAIVSSDVVLTIRRRVESSGCCATLRYRAGAGSERGVRLTRLVMVAPLLAMAVALVVGYIPAASGRPPQLSLGTGFVVLAPATRFTVKPIALMPTPG
jgi:hypothetical protein